MEEGNVRSEEMKEKERGERGRSASTALPDLEPSQQLSTDLLHNSFTEAPEEDTLTSVEEKSVTVAVSEDRKQVTEVKAWIQNSLMTVVGLGVLAYLQTLEGSA